ncbi:MAG: methyltransferase domain-containing protein, partial [Deltaproteobacteria bacterium]|nr:methyltransferase domain-containing protein [Deltaproteobacteria bacterium]
MNADYLLDIPYTNQFYENLNPWLLNYIRAIHGYSLPSLDKGFTYCELGCGNGLSLNVLAAANPAASFFGVDMNPEHIAAARNLAQDGELTNLNLIEENFADLSRHNLPDFDFITLHGVFSWISPQMRATITAFIEQRLKPGGLVMISYNTPQGWAVTAPIRDFLRSFVFSGEGDLLEKAKNGLMELQFLRDSGAAYFQLNPLAASILDSFFQLDLRYIVHEFLTPYWQPMYFSEVLGQMRDVGLEYVGSYPVANNYGEVSVPKELHNYFKGLPDRTTVEMRKDFVNMTLFRSDIYLKPDRGVRNPDILEGYRDLVFGSVLLPAKFSFKVPAAFGGIINLEGDIFKKLVQILAGTSCRAADIFNHSDLVSYNPNELRSA